MRPVQAFQNFWQKISKGQRLVLTLMASFLILGPVSVILTPKDVQIAELYPATPPVTPPNLNPISWETPQVTMKADDFYILVDGKRYHSNVSGLRVISDPGNPDYTTLEGTWHENGVEMRMFWYFYAENYQTTTGTARQWGVSEIRTYNGQSPYADWLYYGEKTSLAKWGQPYSVNKLNLFSRSGSTSGEIHFKNLYLHAFKKISSTPFPTPRPSRTPLPTIKPSPTPWPSPQATVAPSATPAPTPAPVNNLPLITTDSLPDGKAFRPYSAAVAGADKDINDKLTMKASGLPPGLRLTVCSLTNPDNSSENRIICYLKGRPIIFTSKPKTYNVKITLTDNRGGRTQKIIPLTIRRR